MTNEWKLDYTWQRGHNPHEFSYELLGTATPASAASQICREASEVGWIGGARVAAYDGTVSVSSSGEDACDSISCATQVIARVAGDTTIEWTEQPPRAEKDGRPAQRIDGYWIPGDEAADYRDRRAALVERIRELLDDDISVELVSEQGATSLVGISEGQRRFSYDLGSMQLDMMEEADADGSLLSYLLD